MKAEPRSTDTRTQLLNAAGEVFAEKGVDRATSKEICDRAHVNPAAVNYHFGGVDGLYAAALVEAHRHLMQIETLTCIVSGDGSATEKLRTIIEIMVAALSSPGYRSWHFRLLGREILAPSGLPTRLVETQILPKLKILRRLISEIIGLDEDHPAVGRCVHTVVAPCMLLAVGDPKVIATLMPSFRTHGGAAEVERHLVSYAMGGLAAIAAEAKARPRGDDG